MDTHLGDKLRLELPGILAWAVRGCLSWQDKGLDTPAAVTTATTEYRDEMDALAGFIDECVIEGPNLEVTKGNLYDAYKRWCDEDGERAMTKRKLGRRLLERGWQDGKDTSGDNRIWASVGLVTTKKEPPDEDQNAEPPDAEPPQRPLNF